MWGGKESQVCIDPSQGGGIHEFLRNISTIFDTIFLVYKEHTKLIEIHNKLICMPRAAEESVTIPSIATTFP